MDRLTPMERTLFRILEDSTESDPKYGKVAMVQIAFHPGAVVTSGSLRKGEISGTFVLGTLAQATEHTPGDFQSGDMVMVEQIFEASAVQRIMRTVQTSGIVTATELPPQ